MFDRVEKGIERAVNGAFAKAFRSEVEPVEIASALRREIDDRAMIVSRGRTLVPNTFVVELGPADHGRLGDSEDALSDELRDVINEHAGQQQYAFVGPITVKFEEADDLDTGLFRVRSSTTKGPRRVAQAPAQARQPQLQPRPAPSGGRADRPVQAPPPARSSAIQVSLEVEGRTHHVTSTVTVLGRGTEADVVVDDSGVSRRHAEVHTDGNRVWVVDLGSTNGTFVDGERVGGQGSAGQRATGELTDGSRITIGRTRIVVHFGSW
jgi:pSer/pThr/pTyr-binding forkhead associated (FHA) protein